MKKLNYYLHSTYRRKLLDKLQQQYIAEYKGLVLDVGGRDRGLFKKPKQEVDKWIFADIEAKHSPDVVLDVADMNELNDKSVDVVNAMELFEHVEKVEQGLSECWRILKNKGKLLISVPFLYPIHADPFDYQRLTHYKWKLQLEKTGFAIEKIIVMGRFFTVLADMIKTLILSLPIIIKHVLYIFFPLLDLITKLDNLNIVMKHNKLSNFHGGYFIIATKQINNNNR